MPKDPTKTKYFLGVDYGESKIGLAIADSETRIAFVYGTIKNDKELLQNILAIIKKESIGTVVIGVPKRMGDKKIIYAGEKLGKSLEENGINITYQDEIYSTKIARENLKEKELRDINRFDDAEAARIILDSFLQKKAL
ncbi:MAG: RuvX/YqgF family protein [Candidatus Moranbacteria bacterium]|nr:RuvX/YqgF family protein [Candidatus Moranbacteria bacterium]